MAKTTGLIFVVPVRDVDRAVRFYRDAFGLQEVFRNERAGGRVLERGEHAPGVPFARIADPDGNVIEI